MRYPLGLFISLILFAGFVFPQVPGGQQSTYMTQGAFVEVLIPVLGMENRLPPDLANLPPETAFRLETSLLAANGLPGFSLVAQNQLVTRGFLADVVFELVRRNLGIFAAATSDKIRLLAERNIMLTGNETDVLTRDEILAVLNQPVLAQAIAAFYSMPPYLGTGVTDSVNDPFGAYRVKNVTEQVLSPILPSSKK